MLMVDQWPLLWVCYVESACCKLQNALKVFNQSRVQVVPELVVLDTANVNAFLNQYAGQFLPILGLLLLRSVVGMGDWVLKKLGRVKKSSMQEAAEQFTRFKVHIALVLTVVVIDVSTWTAMFVVTAHSVRLVAHCPATAVVALL